MRVDWPLCARPCRAPARVASCRALPRGSFVIHTAFPSKTAFRCCRAAITASASKPPVFTVAAARAECGWSQRRSARVASLRSTTVSGIRSRPSVSRADAVDAPPSSVDAVASESWLEGADASLLEAGRYGPAEQGLHLLP